MCTAWLPPCYMQSPAPPTPPSLLCMQPPTTHQKHHTDILPWSIGKPGSPCIVCTAPIPTSWPCTSCRQPACSTQHRQSGPFPLCQPTPRSRSRNQKPEKGEEPRDSSCCHCKSSGQRFGWAGVLGLHANPPGLFVPHRPPVVQPWYRGCINIRKGQNNTEDHKWHRTLKNQVLLLQLNFLMFPWVSYVSVRKNKMILGTCCLFFQLWLFPSLFIPLFLPWGFSIFCTIPGHSFPRSIYL